VITVESAARRVAACLATVIMAAGRAQNNALRA
jgi:hypothetical protein